MASFPANTTRMQTGQRDAAMPWPLKPAGTIISLPRGVGGWSGLLLRPAEVDFADARNGGDEWRIEFAREAAHFRERASSSASAMSWPDMLPEAKTNSLTACSARARFSSRL